MMQQTCAQIVKEVVMSILYSVGDHVTLLQGRVTATQLLAIAGTQCTN